MSNREKAYISEAEEKLLSELENGERTVKEKGWVSDEEVEVKLEIKSQN